MKLVGLNVRSLTAKHCQIEAELTANKIDILSVSETWLTNATHNNLLRVPGYKIFRLDRKSGKRGGGLAVYVEGKLKVDAAIYDSLNISDADIELFALSISQKCTKPITVLSIYIDLRKEAKNVLLRN